MGSSERGDSGSIAVGGDQFGDLAVIEAVVQAPPTLRARFLGKGAGLAWSEDRGHPAALPWLTRPISVYPSCYRSSSMRMDGSQAQELGEG